MADLVASDVAYTMVKKRYINGRRHNRVRLVFGDGVDTYPAGGIPLDKDKLGVPNVIESLVVDDKGTSGYQFSFDQSAEKLIVMQAPAQTHSHDMTIIGGDDATEAVLTDADGVLGKTEAANRTIEGASAATKGGVNSATLAAAPMSEASAVTIAQQTIEVEVVGY